MIRNENPRVYDFVKPLGEGSFAEVYLVGWRSPKLRLKTGEAAPISQMQINNNRPEYSSKHLVAIKRMKKSFKDWNECEKLKELKVSLLAIPQHPNLIPLYDAFLHPSTKELYFVFESMEGNLYQLTKSRRGRPLAQGLVASLFRQTIAGLAHIHSSGYFHRDMKPENLLITTTGLTDYPSLSNSVERDVTVIVKLADFGLARESNSKPPYTEYVSTRWYRAPEVLLRSKGYGAPVDLWALGTILAEIVNLKPLFPGQSEIDQIYKICHILGSPAPHTIAHPNTNQPIGGGDWQQGLKLASSIGFQFPKLPVQPLDNYFDTQRVPHQFIILIQDLLRFDPKNRIDSMGCFESAYYNEVCNRVDATHPQYIRHQHQRKAPPPLLIQHQPYIPQPSNLPPLSAELTIASPSYSHSSAATSNHGKSSFCSDPSHKRYDSFASSSTNNSNQLHVNNSKYSLDEEPSYDTNSSNATTRENALPNSISAASLDSTLNLNNESRSQAHGKSSSFESVQSSTHPSMHQKPNKASRWLGIFPGSHGDSSSTQQVADLLNPKDAKKAAKEAEKKKREEMHSIHRERARAVLTKQKTNGKDVINDTLTNVHPQQASQSSSASQSRRPSYMTTNITNSTNTMHTKQNHNTHNHNVNMHLPRSPKHLDRLSSPLSPPMPLPTSRSRSGSRSHSETGFKISEDLTLARSKARRRNVDDDHSMSSYSSLHLDADQRSSLSLSRLSFATEHSDPGPNATQSGLRRQPSQLSARTTQSSPHLSHHLYSPQQSQSQSSQANDLAERIDKTDLNISHSHSIPDQHINPIFKLPPFSHISEQADKGREDVG
ncbi:hypothetical protein E3P89_03066 [Wallemia ichthyophaga]|uniref:Protein kinase domain-containing protein n=1 Tax=Wallemia ichthyophaga TaxID=245174 RepID=A0A4T0H3E3_WALIC|nr:hypothetical protein E3P93_03452 [Wallemia ichthyophaga]TIB09879.1 hypothetical protein E3P90_03087 [Wallemia ichthyophaga]TIB20670.1 hypothetical protein E3P89_03066 [Wallemia ichthyophaga]TIB22297.1 hypothetical protein E3P88_03100 [Wallemia ichthyophaga]